MNRKIATAVLATTLTAAGLFASTAKVKPKITMAEARATALKKAAGTVKSEELEHEGGRWIYSFDIATSKRAITEVNVDAFNGKVVAVQHESAAKEAAEKKQETKKP